MLLKKNQLIWKLFIYWYLMSFFHKKISGQQRLALISGIAHHLCRTWWLLVHSKVTLIWRFWLDEISHYLYVHWSNRNIIHVILFIGFVRKRKWNQVNTSFNQTIQGLKIPQVRRPGLENWNFGLAVFPWKKPVGHAFNKIKTPLFSKHHVFNSNHMQVFVNCLLSL
jgi:hypothetical protein